MFQNYIKIAWRNLVRNRVFAAINIVGLAIGLASCLLISLYVLDELSFDRFNEKADQIVRVVFRGNMNGGKINEAHVMPPVAQALKSDYPEVLDATRLREGGYPKILIGETQFTGDNMAFVDSNFFSVFTLPLINGNASSALVAPNSVVISQKLADKYYGKQNAIGKILKVKGSDEPFSVTGVTEEMPRNAHFHYDMLFSMAGLPEARSTSWMQSEYFTYLVLQKGFDYKKLEAKLPLSVDKYMGPQIETAMGMTISDFRKRGNDVGFTLQPLTQIHLHSDFRYDLGQPGDIKYVYIFGAIALIMLIIACINFMNLSTASASKRALEVGVRKVMGSEKSELVWQFLMESIFLTSVSLLLAVTFAALALPLFNTLSGKDLTWQPDTIPSLVPFLLLFGLIVGVLAGSYPAFFLSSFKPIAVLKGKFASQPGSRSLRSGLVVVQFAISICLIIGTAVVYQQLKFIQNKKLGYQKEQVLVLSEAWALGNNQQIFRSELLRDPRVVQVSVSGYVPAGPSYNNNYLVYPDNQATQLVHTLRYEVDPEYIPTLGMQMAYGRNFSRDFGNDSTGVIINETAASVLGWKNNALNHSISRTSNEGVIKTFRVIGVVKDFHFRSLHEKITPLVMTLGNGAGTMLVKIKPQDTPGLLSSMSDMWNQFKPEQPFSYTFLDERFNNTYKAEQKTGQILGVFAALTIFVACLGLFGLATFTAEQRTREIGVRKVLGASVTSIVTLLSRDYIKLVGIAMLFAIPVAWYAMDRWLQDFEYRINVSWVIFVLAGLLASAVAILTVSFQSVKAALLDPVKSLKTD
jgi:putative ABC transport system permease protein